MIYDYIIYPANLFGIAVAIKLSEQGDNVLLLNNYGFVGGSISSALNIYQLKIQTNQSVTNSIFNSLFTDQGILQEEENHILINPEIYKLVCQRFLENSECELLFHVKPLALLKKQTSFTIKLIGKEGLIEFEAKQIIDVSERQDLSILLNSISKKFLSQKINLITLPLNPETELNEIDSKKKLCDGRILISHKIETEKTDENKTQEFITYTSFSLNKIGSRIQILPLESLVSYKFFELKDINGLVNFAKIDLTEIKEDEIFIYSQIIEQYFDK